MAQQHGIAQEPATSGQMSEVTHLLQMALPTQGQLWEIARRCCSDKRSAQALIERAGELKAIRKLFLDLAKEISNSPLHAEQVTKSNFAYHSGYYKARPVSLQIMTLRQYDWGRTVDWTLNEVQRKLLIESHPLGSDRYFAVVFDRTMVTHYEEDPTVDQSVPVTLALNALSKQRKGGFVSQCEGQLGPQYYRRSRQSAEQMRQLWESQLCPTGIILIPAQFGKDYRGMSVSRARAVIRGTEFPLDAFETIQMVLTHENRLNHPEDLWIDAPGGESCPNQDGNFDHCLALRFLEDMGVIIDHRNVGEPSGDYGSVSGFLTVNQIDPGFFMLDASRIGALLNSWVHKSVCSGVRFFLLRNFIYFSLPYRGCEAEFTNSTITTGSIVMSKFEVIMYHMDPISIAVQDF